MARPPSSVHTQTTAETAATAEGRWDFPSAIKRISWGAIFAGTVVALVITLMLNLLGLAIGLGAVNLTGEGATLEGLGTGAIIWLAITTIAAFFAGGWTAGRLAGLPRTLDGLIHGFISWAVANFVIFYLVFSGMGLVIGGALGVVQQGAQLVGQGVAAVGPEAGRAISDQVSVDQIRSEVYATLRATGREDLQPENLAQRARDVQDEAGQAAGEALQQPQDAEEEIRSVFDRLIAHGEEVADAADREAAVNVLVRRTDMTEAEARETVRQYEEAIQDAASQIQATAEDVGETAVRTADDVIAAMGQAALWSFVAMLIGALAGAAGGFTGTPHDLPASTAIRRE